MDAALGTWFMYRQIIPFINLQLIPLQYFSTCRLPLLCLLKLLSSKPKDNRTKYMQ